MSANALELTINGDQCLVAAQSHETLLEVLRYRLALTGTKQGCDKGDCGGPDRVQDAFDQTTALQCGFCQPGMILAAKALLKETARPSDEQIREALANNLCRCTGYTKIFEAVRLAAGIDAPRQGVDQRPSPAPIVDPKAP